MLKPILQEEKKLKRVGQVGHRKLLNIQKKKKDLEDQIKQTDTDNLDVIFSTLSYSLNIGAKTKIRDKDRILICIINFAHN